jgi:phenylacetate-CoA ligase
MRRMGRIHGRSDDMLIVRGVNLFPSQVEAALMREDRFAPHYRLTLTRPERLDELDVEIEIRPELAGGLTDELKHELEARAAHLLKAYVGVTAGVAVVAPDTVERSQGKAKRVHDLRPKE